MAQARRSAGEARVDEAEALRLFLKRQRGRVVHKLERMEQRIVEARRDAMEDWDAANLLRAGGKKPTLDFYDKRGW